ncbi:MAG TPA: flagellar assembly protein FliH [Gammaproteobacteria bacterium]|nr:flagellar assembly protein FliH [Gammaproteobacteria bacterium]
MTVSRILETPDSGESVKAWQPPSMESGAPSGPKPKPRRPSLSVEQIERLQQQAYDEAFAQGRREGYDAGYAEGMSEGRKHGEGEGRDLVRRLDGVMRGVADPVAELDNAAERDLAELALILARQIIRRELQAQPGEVMAVIRESVGLLPLSSREISVHLNPDDAAFVRETVGESENRWRLVEDPALERGGCLVTTSVSRVDATLEKRIGALAVELLGDARRPEGRDDGEEAQ